MTDSKTMSEEIITKVNQLANENNFSFESEKRLLEIIEGIFNQEKVDETLAQRVGEYFYYYEQINEILSKIVRSLLPELDLSVMGLDNSFEGNSYKRKIELIKSLTPNANSLVLFDLLLKLNSVRNKLAHTSPEKISLKSTKHDLLNLFERTFKLGDKLLDKLSKMTDSSTEIDIPVKVIIATKMLLEFFANAEDLGKKEDIFLNFADTARKLSSLYVRRRFSVLAYQFQTGFNSATAPDAFKMKEDFDSLSGQLNNSIYKLFGFNK